MQKSIVKKNIKRNIWIISTYKCFFPILALNYILNNSKRIMLVLGIRRIDKNNHIRALVNAKEYC